MKSHEFLTENINPQVFRRGFERSKEIMGGKYSLTATHDMLPYSPTKKINQSENFIITAYARKGKMQVGQVTFKVTDDNLEAVFVTVKPEFRRQGIAKAMYLFAKELGNEIIPSSMRIYNGDDFGKGISDIYKGGNVSEAAPRFREVEKYDGVIDGIRYVPTEAITPYEDLKSQWQTIRAVMKDDNKTEEQWAAWWLKGRENIPAEVQWWGSNGWELTLVDGHHRYIAAQILKVPLRVEVTAYGVPVEYIERFIVNNDEELRQFGRKYVR